MAQQTASSNGVTAALWGVVEEIDDDDEDILEVTIDVVNDSSRDMWDINGDIRSMDGTHAHPLNKPERIESGEGNQLTFWVPAETGAWLFKIDYNTDAGRGTVELGPFANDLRIAVKAKPTRIEKTITPSKDVVIAKGSDPLATAFGDAMIGFGDEEEIGSPALVSAVESDNPMEAAFAGGIIESQEIIPNQSEMTNVPSPASTPSSPLASPPSGPLASPPSGPPARPPSGPPASPPSGPPASPPSGPPTSPPSGPPTGPPSGAPPGPPPSSSGPPGPPPS